MFFVPFDALGSYQKGAQAANKDNWADIFNAEKAAQLQRKTDMIDQTFESVVGSTNAQNRGVIDRASIFSAGLPGQLAQAGLTSEQQVALALALAPNVPRIAQDQAGTQVLNAANALGAATTRAAQQPGQLAQATTASNQAVDYATKLSPQIPVLNTLRVGTQVADANNAFGQATQIVPAQQGATVASLADSEAIRSAQAGDRQWAAQVSMLTPYLRQPATTVGAQYLSQQLQTAFPGISVSVDPASGAYIAARGDGAPGLPLSAVIASRNMEVQARQSVGGAPAVRGKQGAEPRDGAAARAILGQQPNPAATVRTPDTAPAPVPLTVDQVMESRTQANTQYVSAAEQAAAVDQQIAKIMATGSGYGPRDPGDARALPLLVQQRDALIRQAQTAKGMRERIDIAMAKMFTPMAVSDTTRLNALYPGSR